MTEELQRMAALSSDERERARTVGTMFDSIARRYDLLNRLMSAGQDVRWRREAVASLRPLAPGRLLDIGIGTGDLAFEMRRQHPHHGVVGADLSAGMLIVALDKCAARGEQRVAVSRGDALRLPFGDASFAGAATAFTLRNVADLRAALAETRRVLQPGAPFACLEITRPRGGPLGTLFNVYFQRVVPMFAGAISGRPGAYQYLPRSVERFVTGHELAALMRAQGFVNVRMRRFWPGAVTLHTGRRGAGSG
jgi:demethylmenaquinone methyltransferase/2-methoxy-6-polyprenyl-1,4-benzoquinol methylase